MVDVRTGCIEKKAVVSSSEIRDICLCGSFDVAALANFDSGLIVFDLKEMKVMNHWKNLKDIFKISFVLDSLIICKIEGDVCVVDLEKGEILSKIALDAYRIVPLFGWSGTECTY